MTKKETTSTEGRLSSSSSSCKCPYCDEELKFSCFEPAFCEPCKVQILTCEKCGKPLNAALKAAHKCGEDTQK